MNDGESVIINGIRIFPFRLNEDYVYAFLFEQKGKKVLIAPDELIGWEPPDFVKNIDLAIVPMGVLEKDPFTNERKINKSHPVLKEEATYKETVKIVKKLNSEKTILTHIEEPDGISHNELKELEKRLKYLNIKFAYDSMYIKI